MGSCCGFQKASGIGSLMFVVRLSCWFGLGGLMSCLSSIAISLWT